MQTSFTILSPSPGLYLSFQVGRQQYAVAADRLLKVIEGSPIDSPPMPGCLLGLDQENDTIYPLFDLRFGVEGDAITLLLDVGGEAEYPLVGVVVYGLPESLVLESSQLETLGVGSHFLSGFPLCGVVRVAGVSVFVLEPVGFANTLIAEAPEIETVELDIPLLTAIHSSALA